MFISEINIKSKNNVKTLEDWMDVAIFRQFKSH